MTCSWDADDNIAHGEALVRAAAKTGAQVILLQELLEAPYFCIDQAPEHFDLARSMQNSRVVQH